MDRCVCVWCNKKVRSFKKDDWVLRKFHRKCFREYTIMINDSRLRETALLIIKHNGETLS
jgi:hypothetical protein